MSTKIRLWWSFCSDKEGYRREGISPVVIKDGSTPPYVILMLFFHFFLLSLISLATLGHRLRTLPCLNLLALPFHGVKNQKCSQTGKVTFGFCDQSSCHCFHVSSHMQLWQLPFNPYGWLVNTRLSNIAIIMTALVIGFVKNL